MNANAIGVRGIVMVLWRRIRIIVITASSIVLIVGAITLSLAPLYSATALILAEARDNDLLESGLQTDSALRDSARIDNAVEILKSDTLLLDVIASEDLTSDTYFVRPSSLVEHLQNRLGGAPATAHDLEGRALSNLRAAYTIQRRGLTYVIAVRARSPDPDQAARLANTLAQSYISQQRANKVADIQATQVAMSDLLSQAGTALDASQSRYANLERSQLDLMLRTSPQPFDRAPGIELSAGRRDVPAPIKTQLTLDAARGQFARLQALSDELTAQANLQVDDSRIVSPALVPTTPSFPNKSSTMVLAGLAALGIGIAAAFLYENAFGGITSLAQLQGALQAGTAVSIPRHRGKGGRDRTTSPAFVTAIRRLRAELAPTVPTANLPQGRVVLVCSTKEGEGRTTVALAMARSYAETGHRALLIDADLRAPTLHRRLGLDLQYGLLDFLTEDSVEHKAPFVIGDPASTALVITSSRAALGSTEHLLSGPAFAGLLNAARGAFDAVIIDTPPVNSDIAAVLLARHADAIAFVTRFDQVAQADTAGTVSSLRHAAPPTTVFAAALNHSNKGRQRVRHVTARPPNREQYATTTRDA